MCNWDDFDDRSAEVTAQCCPSDDSCDASDGMPHTCDLACALEFVPFVDQCHSLLEEVMESEIASFDALSTQCLQGKMPQLRAEANDLIARGCVLEGFTAPPPPPAQPPSGGGGHRMLQGLLGLHHHTHQESCPWDSFNDRAEAVNAACCYADPSVCTGGVPTRCDAQCAVVFPTFFDECATTAATILDQMYAQPLSSLSSQLMRTSVLLFW